MAVITGAVKWASVQAPNETFTPVWCVDVVVDEDKAKKLHAEGFNPKRDKDGDIILKVKKNVFRKDGTRNQPPKIVGPDKKPFLDMIGNGSICNVQYNPYDWTYAGKSGKSAGLVALQVVEHVPFDGSGDEFDVVETSDKPQQESPHSDAPEDFDNDLPF